MRPVSPMLLENILDFSTLSNLCLFRHLNTDNQLWSDPLFIFWSGSGNAIYARIRTGLDPGTVWDSRPDWPPTP